MGAFRRNLSQQDEFLEMKVASHAPVPHFRGKGRHDADKTVMEDLT